MDCELCPEELLPDLGCPCTWEYREKAVAPGQGGAGLRQSHGEVEKFGEQGESAIQPETRRDGRVEDDA
jgi:hypothetical protein